MRDLFPKNSTMPVRMSCWALRDLSEDRESIILSFNDLCDVVVVASNCLSIIPKEQRLIMSSAMLEDVSIFEKKST